MNSTNNLRVMLFLDKINSIEKTGSIGKIFYFTGKPDK